MTPFSLECWCHASSNMVASCLTIFWRSSLLLIFNTSRFSMSYIIDLMKYFSSLLSFFIDIMLILMFTSLMPTSMIRGIWSDGFCNSECKKCWPNPILVERRKMRSKIELVLCGLSTYLIGPRLDGKDNSKPKLLAIVISVMRALRRNKFPMYSNTWSQTSSYTMQIRYK